MKQKIHFVILAIFFLVGGLMLPPSSLAADKLLQSSDLNYLGSFKLPNGTLGSTWGFNSYAGCCGLGTYAVTYNPGRNSIYVGGHPYEQRIAEIAVPASFSGTPTATALSNLKDPLEGRLGSINPSDSNSKVLSMALVYNNQLYLAAYSYYDGNVSQNKSHFVRPTDLNITGQVTGPVTVGDRYPGWVDKFAALIPTEWQSALGGPALTGGAGGAINGVQSWGPSVSVFNPSNIGNINPVPATLALGYPVEHPLHDTLMGNNYWSQADVITGMAFPSGTRTVLFFGKHGLGAYCYGTGGTDGDCYDPDDNSKGTHSYPYKSWVWAYDANELVAVKNGQKQSWEVTPYATWNLNASFIEIQGVAYDPSAQRLFVSQVGGDADRPLINVYEVDAAVPQSDTTAPASPTGLNVQ